MRTLVGPKSGLRGLAVGALLAAIGPLATAQDLASFEQRVTKKVLANGLTVLILERWEAPVFSFYTRVNVGSDREVPGITGLAHWWARRPTSTVRCHLSVR